MILVVENDTRTDDGSFVDEIERLLPGAAVYDIVRIGTRPSLEAVDAAVLCGSTEGVYDEHTHAWMTEAREFVVDLADASVPTLGICFGHQLVNAAFGGTVEPDKERRRLVEATLDDDPLFDELEPIVPVLHGDIVTEPGNGMEVIGTTEYDPYFATRHERLPMWSVQFHPEYTHRLRGLVDRWTETSHSFEDCNSLRLFHNFATLLGG